MKRTSYIKGAAILVVSSLIVKIIGALYRVPLTNILGAEGMGLYQLVFPVYALLLSASSGGLPTAISRLVSEKLTTGNLDSAKRTFSSAVVVLLVSGLLSTAGLLLLSKQIALLQGNSITSIGFIVIAPAVFFVSGISAIRGWFQGNFSMHYSARSQIVEQVSKLVLGLGFAFLLKRFSILYAVIGALLGITLSEVVAFIYLLVCFKKEGGTFIFPNTLKEARKDYRAILRLSIPITLGGMIFPLSQFIDSILVVNILSKTMTVSYSTGLYGLFTGPVNSLVNFPIVLTLSLAIAIVPEISGSRVKRDILQIKKKTNSALKLGLAVGLPFMIVYMILPESLVHLLYPTLNADSTEVAVNLLRLTAISVILITYLQIFSAVLQGLDKIFVPVRNLFIGAVFKIVFNLLLLPRIGIYGAGVASVVSFLISGALNAMSYLRLTGENDTVIKKAGLITLSGVIMTVVVLIVYFITPNIWLRFFVGGAIGVLVYGVGLIVLRVFTKEELRAMPFLKKRQDRRE